MRIAFVHNLPSGGGKRSAFEFVRRMVKNHTVDLYYIDPTSEEYLDIRQLVNRAVLVPGPKVRGGIGVFTSLIPAMGTYATVASKINGGGYDLAFVMQCKICNSPFVLNYLRIPSLYYCHEPLSKALEPHYWIKEGTMGALKKYVLKWKVYIDRANARHATLICANSRYSVECIYRSFGITARFNPLGVDTEHFSPLSMEREQIVLSVGALTPAKAQEIIIQSVSLLKTRPTINFIYNAIYKDYDFLLRQLSKRLNVSVSFSKLIKDDDLVHAYNRASLVAYPSRLEPFGFVPLEAMACSTPVVGVAEGGIRETIKHNETGLLTERDPAEFGRAIEVLLEDESLRKRMGENGRQHVTTNWTWEHSYAELEKNLYRVARGRLNGMGTPKSNCIENL